MTFDPKKLKVTVNILLIALILISFNKLSFSANKNTNKSSDKANFINSNNINNSTPDDTVTIPRRKYKKMFYDATGLFFDNHFEQALPIFLELLKYDPDNSHINFYVGACYMNIPQDKATAIPFLQKAIKNTTIWYDYDYRSRAAPVFAYFYLAYVYRNNYKVGDALVNDRIFKSFVSQDNEELMSEVDREIKNLEVGSYVEKPEYTKYYNKPFVNLIDYEVFIRNPEPDVNWWVNNLEGIKRELLITTLLNVAYSGKVNVYDENNNLLTNEQVRAIGNEPTLLKTKTPNPPYNDTIILIDNQLNLQLITKIKFTEEWYIDDQTLEIGKKVVGITPLIEEYFEDNSFKGFKPLFTIYFDDKYPRILPNVRKDTNSRIKSNKDSLTADTAKKPVDLTISTDYNATIKSQTALTERIRYDVPVKSLKSESYWWFENIDQAKREDYLKQLFDVVDNGILQAYDIFDDSLSIKKVRELTETKTDTIRTKIPYTDRDTTIIQTKSNFDYNKVAKYRFLEEWYLNETTAQISKRVVGFAPLVEIFDENKTLKGYNALFWVYFDKKYPIRVSNKIVNFKY